MAKQIFKNHKNIGSSFSFSENKFAKLRIFATRERKKKKRIWTQILAFSHFCLPACFFTAIVKKTIVWDLGFFFFPIF
jgi:TRAP-type mannitol/chloroaromatic compound transport system permease small subunit